MKKILLTGGGTAGHVTPNIALLPDLKAEGYDIHYIGSYEGMEKKLITAQGIHYDGIATGKFRRYLSAKNLTDPFRVIKGFQQAKKLIRDYKPDVVFSKGGFVAVPVVLAAGHYHIPVIIHESDMTPGLANKICMRTAKKICCPSPNDSNSRLLQIAHTIIIFFNVYASVSGTIIVSSSCCGGAHCTYSVMGPVS